MPSALRARTNYAPEIGREYQEGEFVCAIYNDKGISVINAPRDGQLVEVIQEQGSSVVKGNPIFLFD